jgi:predicted NBD/HSP70 family sugar kinase
MTTLRDVAKLAGVSVATVSHAVNHTRRLTPETRARVEGAIAQLGFVPNAAGRMLALQKTGGVATTTLPVADTKFSGDGSAQLTPTQETGTASQTQTGLLLLRLVRAAQPISRVDLASRMNVHRSTVTEITKPLLASGLLREETANAVRNASQGKGRPPVRLTFNTDQGFIVGVNIGVRGIQVGSSELGGQMIDEEEFATPAEPAEALKLIRASIERLCARAAGRTLNLIGVCVPGPTDAERSQLLYAPHIGWHDVAITDALRFASGGDEGADVPVVVENDATAAAMYEARLHLREAKDRSLTDFILVRSGTGIGVGLVLGGEVYRGKGLGKGLAGEFGHMTIVAGGKPCVCGNRGCWERYASASAAASLYMGDRVQLGSTRALRYVQIVERAEAGELRARATLERMGGYLGIGIANVITGFGVQRVILSGRIVYGWKFIRDSLYQAVGQSMAGKLAEWSVEPGEPRGAGLGGALEVAAEEFLSHALGK